MKYLVIAEKSEVGKAIDAAIKETGYGHGDEYRVTAASGHLLELKSPEDCDERYKKWTVEDLPIAFRNWEQVAKKDSETTHGMYHRKLSAIKEGLSWCDEIIHAGDPDDEGQLIVDELLDHFHNKKPVHRLDVNDTTRDYIIRQLKNMQDNEALRPAGRAAFARGVADAMFGFNYTRWFTLKYNSKKPLSIGRVQTPTLGLVVNRDLQIDNHVSQKYYVLNGIAKTKEGIEFPVAFEFPKDDAKLTEGKVLDPKAYDSIIAGLEGRTVAMTFKKKKVEDTPPLPFNLVELQSFCSKSFGLSPEQTHSITQSLRGNSLITYNRSSCQYLHEFQHGEAPGIMEKVFRNIGINVDVDYSIKSKCFNDKYLAGEPHHAIIPTAQSYNFASLTKDEQNVYKAVCLYYIVQFMPNRKKTQTTGEAVFKDGSRLSGNGAVTTDPGYYGFLHKGKTDDEPNAITSVPEGKTEVTVSGLKVEEKTTKPPARYTQASLIKDMTNVAKYVKDPRIKQLLIDKDSDKQKENGSIGTPATRDGIVKTLIDRGYVEETGNGKTKHIESTELGKSFYNALPESIKSLDTTAEWWAITENIQHGKEDESALFDKLLEQIRSFLKDPPEIIPIKGVEQRGSTLPVIGKCPECGRDVVEGKKGFGCLGYRDKENPCNFTIWKDNALLAASHRQMTKTMAKKLLETGKCPTGKLKSKTGKEYEGTFVIGEYNGKKTVQITFDQDNSAKEQKVVGKCPRCGRDVVEGAKGFGCVGYRDKENPCNFTIWKDNKLMASTNKSVTAAMASDLLAGKPVTVELKSKLGKMYKGNFTLEDDGKYASLEMSFADSK